MGTDQSVIWATACITETSSSCPCPVRRRCHSAARVKKAAVVDDTSYASEPGGSSGGIPRLPERASIPPIETITSSVATKSRYGPVSPKSVIEVTTRCPNLAAIAAAPSPTWEHTHTSAPASRVSNSARPSVVERSMITLRLLVLRTAKYRLVPSGAYGGNRRDDAPPAGSTLITSAPRSARMRELSSPRSSVVSMIRMPASGRVVGICGCAMVQTGLAAK